MIEPQQTGIGEDELLDKFEHRMEFELLLNATQTAHARQILSDLMDTLEPRQPDKIEQKLQEIFVECAVRGKLCPRPDDCSSISCSECKIALILALIQPQQLMREKP